MDSGRRRAYLCSVCYPQIYTGATILAITGPLRAYIAILCCLTVAMSSLFYEEFAAFGRAVSAGL